VKHLQRTIKAVIRAGEEGGFVGECIEVAVVTQGASLDDTVRNLQEAVALHLEGEDAADFGLQGHPALIITMEIEPLYAKAS